MNIVSHTKPKHIPFNVFRPFFASGAGSAPHESQLVEAHLLKFQPSSAGRFF